MTSGWVPHPSSRAHVLATKCFAGRERGRCAHTLATKCFPRRESGRCAHACNSKVFSREKVGVLSSTTSHVIVRIAWYVKLRQCSPASENEDVNSYKMVCWNFWKADYYLVIYSHHQELVKSVGSHSSSSLLFMIKVMVWNFVSKLIRLWPYSFWCCFQSVVVEFLAIS